LLLYELLSGNDSDVLLIYFDALQVHLPASLLELKCLHLSMAHHRTILFQPVIPKYSIIGC
jgi:hypothetical protein